eukprot:3918843-Amphidinium_carterae.2
MANVLRHSSWVPQQDGSYRPVDVPGPPDFDTLLNASMCTLRRSSCSVPVRRLMASRCSWNGTSRRAEDKCRVEHFQRLRLKLGQDLDVPWDAVFWAAANDDKYGDRE